MKETSGRATDDGLPLPGWTNRLDFMDIKYKKLSEDICVPLISANLRAYFLGYTMIGTGTCQAQQEEQMDIIKRESIFFFIK